VEKDFGIINRKKIIKFGTGFNNFDASHK